MLLSPKIKKAKALASELHQKQMRKQGGQPYIVHPAGVFSILKKYTNDENILCAAWLHDTLEDVKDYDYKKLKKDFNQKIVYIVQEVSEDKESDESLAQKRKTWKTRKIKYIENMKKASPEALMVAAADKIDNLRSLVKNYQQKGDQIWSVFNAPEPKKEEKIWYFKAVLKVIKARLDNDIILEYEKLLESAERVFNQS